MHRGYSERDGNLPASTRTGLESVILSLWRRFLKYVTVMSRPPFGDLAELWRVKVQDK
jgi:hypothetical protein